MRPCIPDKPRKIAHVNINSADWSAATGFFCEALGFRVIDETKGLVFLRANSPDHNSMVIAKETRSTVNHVAFEMADLDSVMRGAGTMKEHGYPIEWGVGRHGAGNNVFAYFAGPEEFPIEITGEMPADRRQLRAAWPRALEIPARPRRPVGHHGAAFAPLEAHPGHRSTFSVGT